jgi:hypothetical protein
VRGFVRATLTRDLWLRVHIGRRARLVEDPSACLILRAMAIAEAMIR